jgi:hypothetical protein
MEIDLEAEYKKFKTEFVAFNRKPRNKREYAEFYSRLKREWEEKKKELLK